MIVKHISAYTNSCPSTSSLLGMVPERSRQVPAEHAQAADGRERRRPKDGTDPISDGDFKHSLSALSERTLRHQLDALAVRAGQCVHRGWPELERLQPHGAVQQQHQCHELSLLPPDLPTPSWWLCAAAPVSIIVGGEEQWRREQLCFSFLFFDWIIQTYWEVTTEQMTHTLNHAAAVKLYIYI